MNRIYHTWDKWECYPSGFYETKPPKNMTVEQAKRAYAEFLACDWKFAAAADWLIVTWKNSCEHYLTNEKMNRIAWVGQASMCIDSGVSKCFCGGYFLLSQEQRDRADQIALDAINKWMLKNGYEKLSMEQALGKSKADLY